jgi:hypothetical protein
LSYEDENVRLYFFDILSWCLDTSLFPTIFEITSGGVVARLFSDDLISDYSNSRGQVWSLEMNVTSYTVTPSVVFS